MKEHIIEQILFAMQKRMSPAQLKNLKQTLQNVFQDYTILIKPKKNSHSENEVILEDFITSKKVEGCSENTLKYYLSIVECFLGYANCSVTQATTEVIRGFLSKYQSDRRSGKVTIDNMRRILSSFFAWLEDEDYIVKSPVRRIHKVKTDSLVRETLSDEQLEQMRDKCDNLRDIAMLDLLASTGMRVGELVRLNRADLNLQERQCVVFGKGNKERIVYFNARAKIHLEAYLRDRTDSNPALFVSLNAPYRRLQISGVERRLKKLGRSANIERVHPHKFRRTLATMAIDKGMPIEQVQRLLGHVRIDTTLHYAMVSQQNVKMSHRKYLG